jgi:sulfane dehydrogenase subunit SoxC
MSEYGVPSARESHVKRIGIYSQPGTTGSGVSRTPLELLNGTLTPSGLFFERHHAGIPDIDPDQHTLLLHGLVRRPLKFSMAALSRYPMISRIHFLECSGNSGILVSPRAAQLSCGEIHGLVSASEWTGIPLNVLLDEAGLSPDARWIIAEGSDAAMMSRSIPLEKALDDAMVAVYQNGERLRPENGYPLRLLLPGWEGNLSIKWLHRIKVTDRPAMSKEETSHYTDLQADGRSIQFTFPMAVKSVITSPAAGLKLHNQGYYEVNGIAWSGSGRVKRVDVSADGGASWAPAVLDEPVLPKHLTRFRAAWQWSGQPATLMSRAVDETGAVQPTRDAVMAGRGSGQFYHYNAVQAWRIDPEGGISNVYA